MKTKPSEDSPIAIVYEGGYIWKTQNHIKTMMYNYGSHGNKWSVQPIQRAES